MRGNIQGYIYYHINELDQAQSSWNINVNIALNTRLDDHSHLVNEINT